jgi:hypothetical protein
MAALTPECRATGCVACHSQLSVMQGVAHWLWQPHTGGSDHSVCYVYGSQHWTMLRACCKALFALAPAPPSSFASVFLGVFCPQLWSQVVSYTSLIAGPARGPAARCCWATLGCGAHCLSHCFGCELVQSVCAGVAPKLAWRIGREHAV